MLLLAVLVTGLALGSGAALSDPVSAPDAQIDSRVVGGEPVPDGKYSYIAAVRYKATPQRPYCAGTLIDRDSVLTAAHCFAGKRKDKPGLFRVVLGRTNLKSDKGVVRDVKRIFRHPRFRMDEEGNNLTRLNRDAAVLKLGRPVDGITPLKLAEVTSGNRLERPGSYATVAGWGNTVRQSFDLHEPDSFPNRMREARVPIVRDSVAKDVYDGLYVPETLIAAGSNGKDTCQGDSGAPLIKKGERNGKTMHVQIGITSFGAGCGVRRVPAVYAEVNSPQIAPFIKGAAKN
jgi:secreted trypsin-like serine protease